MSDNNQLVAIDPAQDNLSGLEFYENKIEQSYKNIADTMIAERTSIMVAVATILDNKLWRHRKDGQGKQVYNKQEDYLPEIEKYFDKGRASIFNYLGAMKTAKALGYDTEAKIDAVGGGDAFVAVRKYVSTDRETGEPTGLKSGKLPDGEDVKDFVVEVIEQANVSRVENELPEKEFKDTIRTLLQRVQVRIWYTNGGKDNSILWHKEIVEDGSPRHNAGTAAIVVFSEDTPEDVIKSFYGLFKIEK